MKSILLIGLGRFGIHMAQKLHELHHEVLAVDSNEERVNNVMDFVLPLHRSETVPMKPSSLLSACAISMYAW